MASLGHGISDAVRNHIPVWVDDQVVDLLYTEYKNTGGVLQKDGFSGFRARIKDPKNWVRKSRRQTNSGYERLYACKPVQKATLVVHSPQTDMSANGYVFQVDGKVVAGGKTKLKSVQVDAKVSKNDKTSSRLQDIAFVKFSEEDVRRMRTQMEFGDGYDYFEDERQA